MFQKIIFFLFFSPLLFAQTLEVYFEGNEALSQRELYSALELHQPRFYEFYKDHPRVALKTLDLLLITLKNFYKTKGYYQAQLEYTKHEDRVTFFIKENEPLLIQSLSVNAQYDLYKLLKMEQGDVFASDLFTQSKKEIEYFYAQKGFCNADINAKAWIEKGSNSAYLLYDVAKNSLCYFGKIEVEGSEKIDASVIRSLLSVEEGELFSREAIEKSYRKIYQYDGILDTSIELDKHGKSPFVDLSVKIKENPKPLRFEAGLGYSSDEGAMGLLAFKHRNFIKDLQSLGLSLRVTEIKQTLMLRYDAILEEKNFQGANLGFEDERFIGFHEQRVFGAYYLKQVRGLHSFQESLVLDNAKVYRSDPLYHFGNHTSLLLSPKIEYIYDTRDKLLDPSKGYFVLAEIIASKKGAFSDASYYKYNLSGAYLYPYKTQVFGVKTSYGALEVDEGKTPPSYRFFAGGMHSNRAYGYRELGEKNIQGDPLGAMSLFESSFEWRFALIDELRGVLFSDISFLGEESSPQYHKAYTSLGFGLRYKTPIGPIAVDFGFDTHDPKENYAIHFHIGELF